MPGVTSKRIVKSLTARRYNDIGLPLIIGACCYARCVKNGLLQTIITAQYSQFLSESDYRVRASRDTQRYWRDNEPKDYLKPSRRALYLTSLERLGVIWLL